MQKPFDVNGWLKSLGLEKYAASFVENGIDQPAVIAALTADDLKDDLGVHMLGDRKKILLAAEQLKGGSGGPPPPGGGGKSPASSSSSSSSSPSTRQQGDIRSIRWPNGDENCIGNVGGVSAPSGLLRSMIATERDSDPYRLIMVSDEKIDFLDPAGGVVGPTKSFKKPHLDDRYTKMLSCDVVGNTMLVTGGLQVAGGAQGLSIVVVFDVTSGEARKVCKFGNEDSFTSGVLIGDNKQAVVSKWSTNDNLFVVDLEKGFVASRWKNDDDHYGAQLLRDPHDPNIVFASPAMSPVVTVWDIRNKGKAPVRQIGFPSGSHCVRKPLNGWNRNALVVGTDSGFYVYDTGSGREMVKVPGDSLRGWATYGNVVAATGENDEWLFWDLNEPSEPVQKLNARRCNDLEMDHNGVYGSTTVYLYYATYE